jgi:hypothetical protein
MQPGRNPWIHGAVIKSQAQELVQTVPVFKLGGSDSSALMSLGTAKAAPATSGSDEGS